MKSIIKQSIIAATCFSSFITAIDNHHFYRASYLFFEPRFEREWLTSFDVSLATGSSSTAFDGNGSKVPLLDIYGTHNMQQLGTNVPGIDEKNPLDKLLKDLASLPPSSSTFATFSIGAQFKINEATLSYIQNIKEGFFIQCALPIRSLEINSINIKDLSPLPDIKQTTTNNTPSDEKEKKPLNTTTPEWVAFKNSFDKILALHKLSKDPVKNSGIGDFGLFVGWTMNNESTEDIDFFDFTCKAGVLFPSGKAKNVDQILSIPLGYNKHWGFPLSITGAVGFYEWLTLGAHVQGILFTSRDQDVRIKTNPTQSSLIKLTRTHAQVDKGALIDAGVYLKADHFIRGLSCTLGYTMAHQGKSRVHANRSFDDTIVNSDQSFDTWTMHTFHLFIEYDFTKEYYRYGPRIGFVYNKPFAGEHIFITRMLGGTVGLDIAWDW